MLRVVIGWSGLVSVVKAAEDGTEVNTREAWVRNENSEPMVTEIPVLGKASLNAGAEEEVPVGRLMTGVERVEAGWLSGADELRVLPVTKGDKLVTTSGGVEVGDPESFTVSAIGVLDGGGAVVGGGGVEEGEDVGLRMPERTQPMSVQFEEVGVAEVLFLSVSAGGEEVGVAFASVSCGGVLDGGGVLEGGGLLDGGGEGVVKGGRQPRPRGSKQSEDEGACEDWWSTSGEED